MVISVPLAGLIYSTRSVSVDSEIPEETNSLLYIVSTLDDLKKWLTTILKL